MTFGELYCEKIALLIGGINQLNLLGICSISTPGIRHLIEHFDRLSVTECGHPPKKRITK